MARNILWVVLYACNMETEGKVIHHFGHVRKSTNGISIVLTMHRYTVTDANEVVQSDRRCQKMSEDQASACE